LNCKIYTIHLVNRTQLSVCVMFPDECERSIEEDFREALATTGMLEIEGSEGVLEMIPVSNIMRIHCVPQEGDSSPCQIYEDDNLDDEYGEDDELDEDDE